VTLKSGLTPKQSIKIKKLARGLAAGKTMADAALSAGYGKNKKSARVHAYEALQNSNIKKTLEKALEDAGISADSLTAEIKKGLKQGKIGSHDKYLELALRLRGDLSKSEATVINIQAVIASIRAECVKRGLPE
jgi:phage terminase small subunit